MRAVAEDKIAIAVQLASLRIGAPTAIRCALQLRALQSLSRRSDEMT